MDQRQPKAGNVIAAIFDRNHDGEANLDDLADIFVGHGLPANSAAKIRIHACNSGSPATFGATQLKSFAERLKTDLVSKGRNNVTVRGYTCAMGIYLLGYRHGSFPFVPADVYAVDF